MLWMMAALPVIKGFHGLSDKAKKDKEFREHLPWLATGVQIAHTLLSRSDINLNKNISEDHLSQVPLPGGSFGLFYTSEAAELSQEWGTERGAQLMGVGRARYQRATKGSR